ncbi:hypothetical protein ACFCYB_38175 [Streptomyces sp. NPDC056309]|uniref:hypothetical protein n=1 Tax=unclassified Streptomyces TaxID=2593676 RepID=UPI0035D82309
MAIMEALPHPASALSERRAALLAEPLQLTVSGVATLDQSNNLTGLERQITPMKDATAPDEPNGGDALAVAPLRRAHSGRR